MKILHVIPWAASRYGGPSQAIWHMGRELASAGTDVTVATTDADGPGHLPVRLGEIIEHQRVPTIFFHRQWHDSFQYSSGLGCWLRAHAAEYDVVHIHGVFSHPCLSAASACQRRGVPYIVRPFGSLDPWSMRQSRFRKQVFWHLVVRRMLEQAAAVHYTADEEKRLAEASLGLKRGVVVPLGVDAAVLDNDVSPDLFRQKHPGLELDPYVLFLARLHPKKGVELLIEAFLDLQRVAPLGNWRLVLAGMGDPTYVRRLHRVAERRSGTDRVLFVGWLEGSEKLAAIKGAGLLALPSYQENFAVAVAEAMGSATPVLVSTHVNLAGDITARGAGWIAPLEREGLKLMLANALASEHERHRRGAAGQSLVRERFMWPVVAARLQELYQAVTEGRALPHHRPLRAELRGDF